GSFRPNKRDGLNPTYGRSVDLNDASPPLRSEAERGRVQGGGTSACQDGAEHLVTTAGAISHVRQAVTCRRAPTRAPSRATSPAAQGRCRKETRARSSRCAGEVSE